MDGERIDPRTLTSPEGLSLVGQDCLGPVQLWVCKRQGTVWFTVCIQNDHVLLTFFSVFFFCVSLHLLFWQRMLIRLLSSFPPALISVFLIGCCYFGVLTAKPTKIMFYLIHNFLNNFHIISQNFPRKNCAIWYHRKKKWTLAYFQLFNPK